MFLNKKIAINFLFLGVLLLLSNPVIGSPQVTGPNGLKYIEDGIRHFRTSLPNLSAKISYSDGRFLLPTPAQDCPQMILDMPVPYPAVVYWISLNGDLSVDVKFEGNLDADRGDNTWLPIGKRMVISNGSVSMITEYRKRIPNQKGGFVEKRLWSGDLDVKEALTDGGWCEFPNLDPRNLMYTESGTPLDKIFQDSRYQVSIKTDERLYGSDCAVVEMDFFPKNGPGLVSDYWIDLSHDFMLRKEISWMVSSIGKESKRTLFFYEDAPILQHLGSYCLPVRYSGALYDPEISAAGKHSIVTRYVTALFAPMPSTYAELSNPFSIKWPAGTHANDMTINKRYVADSSGTLKEVSK